MDRKQLSRTAKEFIAEVAYGFREVATHSLVPPWEVSYLFINDLRRIETSPEDFREDSVLFTLEMASDVDYRELKKYWDKLSIEERKEAIHKIIQAMAALGLMAAVGSIAINTRPSQKEEILRIASEYDKGEITYKEMVSDIEDVLWPTREERAKYWKDIEEYEKVMALADYLPAEAIKRIIRAYFIDMIRLQMFDTYFVVPSVYPNLLE